jgi:hypothetical protein
MPPSLKTVGPLVITLTVGGVAISFLGLPHGSAASPEMPLAVTISPEDLTRAAGPMLVREIEHYL